MQSYDFMVMARDFDVRMEFGGDDQWSNIIGGSSPHKKKWVGKRGLRHDFLPSHNERGQEDG